MSIAQQWLRHSLVAEWRSDVASRRNPDGTVSFLTIAPGAGGFEFVVGGGDARTLTVRDAQHEYVFREAEAAFRQRAAGP
jgi:hypothetical protein